VHTSTKARVTSSAIWRINMSSKLISQSGKQSMYPDGDPPKFIHLFIGHLKISCKSVWNFLRKVANRQTNNDENTSSLAEVTALKAFVVTIDVILAGKCKATSVVRLIYSRVSVKCSNNYMPCYVKVIYLHGTLVVYYKSEAPTCRCRAV